MIGHVPRADARPEALEIRIGGGIEVTALACEPKSVRLAPVMLENVVDDRPRDEGGKPVAIVVAVQMAAKPVGRQKLAHRYRRHELGEPPGIVPTCHLLSQPRGTTLG